MTRPGYGDEDVDVTNRLEDRIKRLELALKGGMFQPGDLKVTAQFVLDDGFLICDHTSYLRTDFPVLFDALGGAASPWGLPDGTHFNVPNLGSRALVVAGAGAGISARALAALFGTEPSNMPSHDHGGGAHAHSFPGDVWNDVAGGAGITPGGSYGLANIGTNSSGVILSAQGTGSATDGNVPPSSAVNVWIKT